MGKFIGLMAVGIKGNGKMVYRMEWGKYTCLEKMLKKGYFRIMF